MLWRWRVQQVGPLQQFVKGWRFAVPQQEVAYARNYIREGLPTLNTRQGYFVAEVLKQRSLSTIQLTSTQPSAFRELLEYLVHLLEPAEPNIEAHCLVRLVLPFTIPFTTAHCVYPTARARAPMRRLSNNGNDDEP